jgi:hypothetical protein
MSSDLHEAVEMILEPVVKYLNAPPALRNAVDEVYLVLDDKQSEDENAADMHMELLRELEDRDGKS